MTGQQILNYKIIAEIGSGGMATVYKAVHTKLDTEVAVKILKPVLAIDENIKKRFIQEAKIMASLDHENITRVIDFDDEQHLAIVMELLKGKSLNQYIKEKKEIDIKQILDIFSQILKAFAFAHNKGIVHRDIKPSNIFITNDGKVKIMDFGIAKIVEKSGTILTQTGSQIGTPVYMSPEQVNDAKHIDYKTDIYSLGVMLWHMLSGKPPYDTDTMNTFSIYTKIVNDKLPDIKEFPVLSEVIQKATRKNPEDRFQNCDEFLNAINKTDIKKEKTPPKTEKQKKASNNEKTIIKETPNNYDSRLNLLTDPQGNTYKTVKIGNQIWMAENLNLDVGEGCWCYDNDPENCKKYGKLYTWEAAKRAADQIPGWHLPTDNEWKELEMFLGMSEKEADKKDWRGKIIGYKLKSSSGWKKNLFINGNGDNQFNFSAYPGGFKSEKGFYSLLYYSLFWTSTPIYCRYLGYNTGKINRSISNNNLGLSVRLIKDN